MNLREIVAEWQRGCSNVEQHYKEGVPFAPDPGGCLECTAGAMRAIARLVCSSPEEESMVKR